MNVYELDETGLSVQRLGRDAEWFDFVFQNRRERDTIAADVIIGPVANDTIFETLGIISSGYLDPAEALALLRVGPEYTQAAVKTQKAAGQLRFLGTEHIARMDRALRKKEQEAYEAAFAAALEKMAGN